MTILETTPIMVQPHSYMWMIVVGIICFILSYIISMHNLDSDIISIIAGTLACIFIILLAIGIVLDICVPKIDTGRLQYTIRLDDTVSVNEFYEKYKVIEHTKYTDVYVVEEIIND